MDAGDIKSAVGMLLALMGNGKGEDKRKEEIRRSLLLSIR